ncbi:MAG: hypothetical protein ACUVWN_09440 [bacterium]
MYKYFVALTLSSLILLFPVSSFAAKAQLKTGENVLACANFNDGLSSSDMTLIVQLDADGNMLVNEGSKVKYLYPTVAVSDDWIKPTFDDSSWTDGISGVGFADGDDNTEVPAGKSAVIYTRYRFKVDNATAIKKLIFRADYDDGYVAWLNGTEIARSASMAAGGSTVGTIPPWDYSSTSGKVTNHEASDMPKGTPNTARNYQDEFVIEFDAIGQATAVKSVMKLATTWGEIRTR